MSVLEAAGPSAGFVTEDYDVFLNHRGPDVKATFVAHLEDALRNEGFRPFLDVRSLMVGGPALKSIDQALNMAKVHVAVVSKGYAESKYCLSELVDMLRSGKPVVSVLYDVEPKDLRCVETGPFAKAFRKHKSGRNQHKVQEWIDALSALAKLTPFRLADYKQDEAMLKHEVVSQIARLIPSNEPLEVERYRVGLEGPVNRCIQAMEKLDDGIGILSLVGMGGVGKTTLAKEIYNHCVAQRKFRNMTFLEVDRDRPLSSSTKVRPTWAKKLRKQLLWDLLRVHDHTSCDYSSWFRKVSTLGPVMIVIDDIHKLSQFEALVPFASDLHPSSCIIMTSRDRSLVKDVVRGTNLHHHMFNVPLLDSHESNVLFYWHAFNSDVSPEGFQELAQNVVGACGGLPLALKTIGSILFDKRDGETIWQEGAQGHALIQSSEVMEVLRWSYDSLSESEKLMFLDITCLFHDKCTKDLALAVWESCEDCISCGGVPTPRSSLHTLADKCLITFDPEEASFKVHKLLVAMGQEIAKKDGRHFVKGKFAAAIVTDKQGTEKTRALNLVGSRKRKFEAEDFGNMPNLHFLELPDRCIVNGDFKYMSRELRWLRWRGMSFSHTPTNFDVSQLTSLDFSESTDMASLWMEESNDGFEGCPNLRWLNLKECTSITKLPDSIGLSSQLQYLNLIGCTKLEKLPKSTGQLKQLKYLYLSWCTSLKTLPDAIVEAFQLRSLELDNCSKLKKLPKSIGQLKELKNLNVCSCTSLTTLPNSIGALSNLQTLSAYNCTSLVKLPTSIKFCSSLQTLWLGMSTECHTFSEVGNIGEAWTRLRSLRLFNCHGLGSLLNYGALKSLEELALRDNTLTKLPESIGLLIRLQMLTIECERLQSLPKSIGDLKMLRHLELSRCDNLKTLPSNLDALTSLECLRIQCFLIKKLPRALSLLPQVQILDADKLVQEFAEAPNFHQTAQKPFAISELTGLWEHR